MNSNIEAYVDHVVSANSKALECNVTTMLDSLPGLVCRELEVVQNQFVDSSDPLMVSYRSLRRIQRLGRPLVPRKLEFDSAVYLKEGIIDCLFPNSDVTLLFIGDGNSDKRFSYNCHRLFGTFSGRFRIYSFICNPDLLEKPFEVAKGPSRGWDETGTLHRLFYHAVEWTELPEFLQVAADERAQNRQVLVLVDIDGTYLCPRPKLNSVIKDARREAIVSLCSHILEPDVFDRRSEGQVSQLKAAYNEASASAFSRTYDDEDLTMLIGLGLYAGLIEKDDPLLDSPYQVRFTVPVEWLRYASFLIDNNAQWEFRFRKLRTLFIRCADRIQAGLPTAFPEFREEEERVLRQWAADDARGVRLNRRVTEFIRECAVLGAVPIAFSDRPNASLGLDSSSGPSFTADARPESLVSTSLALTA